MASKTLSKSSPDGQPSVGSRSSVYLPSSLPEGYSRGISNEEFSKFREWVEGHAESDGLQAYFATAALSSLDGLEAVLNFSGPAVWRPFLH